MSEKVLGNKQTSTPTTTSMTTLPYDRRDWIDVEPGPVRQELFRSVKKDDQIASSKKTEQSNSESWHRMSRSEFTSSQHWSIRAWLNYLQRGGEPKKRFQHCVDRFHAHTILYFRAVQGHSGGKHINPTLQDNVLLPDDFAVHIYHVGSSNDTHSII